MKQTSSSFVNNSEKQMPTNIHVFNFLLMYLTVLFMLLYQFFLEIQIQSRNIR